MEYLGMTIDFTVKGKVKISRYGYIQKLLNELPVAKTPAAAHNVDENAEKLDENKAQMFHHL